MANQKSILKSTKSKIIVEIDYNIVETTQETYDKAYKLLLSELKKRDMHFDESPFMFFIILGKKGGDFGYWGNRIVAGKKVNNKFDIINYVKTRFDRMNKSSYKFVTCKEKLQAKRNFENAFNFI